MKFFLSAEPRFEGDQTHVWAADLLLTYIDWLVKNGASQKHLVKARTAKTAVLAVESSFEIFSLMLNERGIHRAYTEAYEKIHKCSVDIDILPFDLANREDILDLDFTIKNGSGIGGQPVNRPSSSCVYVNCGSLELCFDAHGGSRATNKADALSFLKACNSVGKFAKSGDFYHRGKLKKLVRQYDFTDVENVPKKRKEDAKTFMKADLGKFMTPAKLSYKNTYYLFPGTSHYLNPNE